MPGATVVSSEHLEDDFGDKLERTTALPVSEFEEVYRRALDEEDDGGNSDRSDDSEGTYPSVIAVDPAVVTHAGNLADEVVRDAISGAAAGTGQSVELVMDSDDEFEFLERQIGGEEGVANERPVPVGVTEAPTELVTQPEKIPLPCSDGEGDEFELLERQLLSEGVDAGADEEFEKLERQLAAEDRTTTGAVGSDDGGSNVKVVIDDSQHVGDETEKFFVQDPSVQSIPSSPVVECSSEEIQSSTPPKPPSPEPLVSSPTGCRRAAPVHRHETFHHVPRVTVTDTDDVRDATDGQQGLVVEPDDDSDSDAGGRPTIVELADDDDATGNPSVVDLLP